jgi:hypothetical protein
MPDKCAIVGCHTNYSDGQKRSVFYFPKDEELRSGVDLSTEVIGLLDATLFYVFHILKKSLFKDTKRKLCLNGV